MRPRVARIALAGLLVFAPSCRFGNRPVQDQETALQCGGLLCAASDVTAKVLTAAFDYCMELFKSPCTGAESCSTDPDGAECEEFKQCLLTNAANLGEPEATGGGDSGHSEPGGTVCSNSSSPVTDDEPVDEEDEKAKARCPYCSHPMERKKQPMKWHDKDGKQWRMWQYHCTNKGVIKGGGFGHGDISGKKWYY